MTIIIIFQSDWGFGLGISNFKFISTTIITNFTTDLLLYFAFKLTVQFNFRITMRLFQETICKNLGLNLTELALKICKMESLIELAYCTLEEPPRKVGSTFQQLDFRLLKTPVFDCQPNSILHSRYISAKQVIFTPSIIGHQLTVSNTSGDFHFTSEIFNWKPFHFMW